MTQDKIRFKKELARVNKDIDYFINNWEMTKNEAISYMLEITRIRLSILDQKCRELNIKDEEVNF